MKRKFKVVITFAILILIVAIMYFFTNWFSAITGYTVGESEHLMLASCLNKQGAELYISQDCPECELQKTELGPAFNKVSKFDCSKENCPSLESVPAWRFPDKTVYGFKTFSELVKLGKCN